MKLTKENVIGREYDNIEDAVNEIVEPEDGDYITYSRTVNSGDNMTYAVKNDNQTELIINVDVRNNGSVVVRYVEA
ncbi:hypothetical protein NYE69_12780 [Paenibacillus sp. FSL R5-0527]|uniref:hypothetical protein n=1 Tax=Paenibacillus sp. FSL R5-0527 TaxID=2975321 RepID=UPI00097B9D78|nr:hypothetical protein BK140_17025 [Paenibacillus macerans]